MDASQNTPRPPWARRLDRWTLRGLRWLGPLLRRSSDSGLVSLARAARPSPPVRVPTAEELGIIDHLADGRRALEAGMFAEALHSFACRLEETADTDAWAWHGRGDALQLLGDPPNALAAYREAAARQPDQGIHRMGCANALDAMGRKAEADAETIAALALDPGLTWMRPPPDSMRAR